MRLWWISAAALVVVFCAIGEAVSVDNNGQHVETNSRSTQTSAEGKVLVKRRRKLDEVSNESENVSSNQNGPSEASASPEDTSLPKSTTFIQSRAAMFDRLNQPLLRNRALDTTISKLRSRLGALASSEEPSPKKRLIKKIKKPLTTAASVSEESPISIQVPRDQHQHEGNDSMIMIPVPQSQRKPYQPVIMQVTKSNESSTAAPDTKVVTYKLNKMFVPIGIYGRVVGDVEENNTTSTSSSQSNEGQAKGLEIRHKGTQSESSEKFTGVKVSEGYDDTVAYEEEKWTSKDGKKISKVKKLRKPKEHSRIADSVEITYDYKPNYDQISIASERPDISKISLTTLSPLDSILSSGGNDENDNRRVWGGNPNKNEGQGGMTRMSPPRPMNKESGGSSGSFLDTIKQTASNFPSFLHKGLTSLSSITSSFNENPFHDDTFTSASEMKPAQHRNSPGVVASIPGGYLPQSQHQQGQHQQQLHKQRLPPASSIRDYESLEFFRNRPHLFGRGRKLKHPKANSGFRPVTPSPQMNQDYYESVPASSTSNRKIQRDSEAAGSHDSIVNEHPSTSSWSAVDDSNAQMVPSEDTQSSWKEYLFSSAENAGSSRSWRNFFGLAPAIEQSSMMNPTYGGNTMDGGRRRSLMMDRQWKSITSKYSKNEIDEAKMKIHKYFSGPESRSFEEKPSFGGAFDDLLKMFQLWFNVGTGRSVAPLKSYEHIQSEARSAEDSWKPISKGGNGGKPLISFSAGISFPTKNPGGGRSFGSHYSASAKPFIPHKHGNSLTNHITTLAHNYVGPTDPTGYGEETQHDSQHFVTTFTDEGADEYIPEGEVVGEDGYSSSGSEFVPVVQKSKSAYHKGSLKAATLKADIPQESSSYHSSSARVSGLPEVDGDDSQYELVPSDVYFKNNRNPDMGEIAGVVKPAGVSDDVVKAHLPPGVAGIPTFTYPSHFRKNPPGSLNKLQKFLTTADGKPMESSQSYKKRVDAYKKKEQSFMLPQQFYDAQYSSLQSSQTRNVPQVEYETESTSSSLSAQALNAIQHQQLQSLSSAKSTNGIIQQQTRVKTSGDSTSSGVELPSNLDPDIAAMIRAELDKDDVPEEIRSGFQEPKKQRVQEKQRNQQVLRQPSGFQSQYSPTNNRRSDFSSQYLQHQSPYANRQQQQHRPSPTFPLFHFNGNQRAHGAYGFHNRNVHHPQGSHSHSQQVVQKFFAPIPISPTIMSQTLKGRYQSPVPRYVVELAKKLKRDKDVQGIVRVSTKRGNGPPIEYLYPVRG